MTYLDNEKAKNSTNQYQSAIKNVSRNEWLKKEEKGAIEHTAIDDKKMVFRDELVAESTLEYLNDCYPDTYVLLEEDDEKSLYYQEVLEV